MKRNMHKNKMILFQNLKWKNLKTIKMCFVMIFCMNDKTVTSKSNNDDSGNDNNNNNNTIGRQ